MNFLRLITGSSEQPETRVVRAPPSPGKVRRKRKYNVQTKSHMSPPRLTLDSDHVVEDSGTSERLFREQQQSDTKRVRTVAQVAIPPSPQQPEGGRRRGSSFVYDSPADGGGDYFISPPSPAQIERSQGRHGPSGRVSAVRAASDRGTFATFPSPSSVVESPSHHPVGRHHSSRRSERRGRATLRVGWEAGKEEEKEQKRREIIANSRKMRVEQWKEEYGGEKEEEEEEERGMIRGSAAFGGSDRSRHRRVRDGGGSRGSDVLSREGKGGDNNNVTAGRDVLSSPSYSFPSFESQALSSSSSSSLPPPSTTPRVDTPAAQPSAAAAAATSVATASTSIVTATIITAATTTQATMCTVVESLVNVLNDLVAEGHMNRDFQHIAPTSTTFFEMAKRGEQPQIRVCTQFVGDVAQAILEINDKLTKRQGQNRIELLVFQDVLRRKIGRWFPNAIEL